MTDIYSDTYVKKLFDEMSKTYGLVNLFSSLGFSYFWRRACIRSITKDSIAICDLMAGGAESLIHIRRNLKSDAMVSLVDFSDEMCKKADLLIKRRSEKNAEVLACSALRLPVDDKTFDAVVSTFGLKTLSDHDLKRLVLEIKRVLKPNGVVSMLEFSMPDNTFIQVFFRLYVKHYVPFLGRLFLGNPDNYRMLWEYTVAFQNCKKVFAIMVSEGFKVQYKRHFLGSATQVVGII